MSGTIYSGTSPKLAWPIVITADNGALRFDAAAAGPWTATVPPGLYYWRNDGTAADLCVALGTAMDGASGAPPGTFKWSLSADGKTHLTAAALTDLLWTDALTTLDAELCGYDRAADVVAIDDHDSLTQAGRLWVPEREYPADTGDLPEHALGGTVCPDGSQRTQSWGRRLRREILIDLIPPARVFSRLEPAAGVDGYQEALIGQDGEDRPSLWWSQGLRFEFCPDFDVASLPARQRWRPCWPASDSLDVEPIPTLQEAYRWRLSVWVEV